MRWTIYGADKKSGEEKTIAVEAASRAEAERAAVKMGLLISSIREPNAVPLDYQNPKHTNGVPDYPGIVKGATLLKQTARSYRVLAVVSLVAMVCGLGGLGIGLSNGNSEMAGIGIASAVVFLLVAMALDSRAKMIELNADLALATRDIARNSFMPE